MAKMPEVHAQGGHARRASDIWPHLGWRGIANGVLTQALFM
jgi:hypothetical protein